MATVLSNLIMNVAKTLVIWRKFQILPFDWKTLGIFGLIVVCGLTILWDMPFAPVLNIAVRSVLVSFVYLLGLILGNFSPNNPAVVYVKGKIL